MTREEWLEERKKGIRWFGCSNNTWKKPIQDKCGFMGRENGKKRGRRYFRQAICTIWNSSRRLFERVIQIGLSSI